MTYEPPPDDISSPGSLNTMEEFGAALDELRSYLNMTIPKLALEANMSPEMVRDFLNARLLPQPSELHNLLLALRIRARWQQDQWELALIRVRQQVDRIKVRPYVLTDAKTASFHGQARAGAPDSEESDRENLLLRVYIPSARLYATEASRLLSLFREWLTMTRGYGVRQSGYHTASGEMYEFFVDAAVTQAKLNAEFDSFSDFLTLCSEDTSAATHVLTSAGIDRTSSVKLVARFGKEVQRLQIDLRHEREQRMLSIRQLLEEQLLESGVDLRSIPTSQINALIENYVPGPTAPESLALLASPWNTHSTAPVTVINNPQIINTIESTIIQNVQGTIHLGLEAKKLLAFIERFGGQAAATMQSAVYELEDSAAPPATKSSAKQQLKMFVSQVAGFGRDVGVELLADYLRSKGL